MARRQDYLKSRAKKGQPRLEGGSIVSTHFWNYSVFLGAYVEM